MIVEHLPKMTLNSTWRLTADYKNKLLHMKNIILILAATLLLPVFLNAQSLNAAQKLMDKFDYSGAIVILSKVESDPKVNTSAVLMLAECYRLQHDIENTTNLTGRFLWPPGHCL